MDEIGYRSCGSCGQRHRDDYRVWSDYFQRYMTPNEFVSSLNTGRVVGLTKEQAAL